MRTNLLVILCALGLSVSPATADANPAELLNQIEADVNGSDNQIHLTQGFVAGATRDINRIELSIQGNGNGAGIGRAWRLDLPAFSRLAPGTLSQLGAGNTMAVRVTGDGNLFAMSQHGEGNRIDAIIAGNDNQASVAQTGTGNVASFSQTGNGNVIAISQSSW